MSGMDILKDDSCIGECFGLNLDKLVEGDRVGVMRTSRGELEFYINNESQGIAATGIPKPVWAVVNLYGKCVQVSMSSLDVEHTTEICQNIAIPISVDVTMPSTTQQHPNVLSSLRNVNYLQDLTFLHSNSVDTPSPQSSLVPAISGVSVAGAITSTATIPSSSAAANSLSTNQSDLGDRLHFHARCGSLVILSNNNRTAERRRPLDEFNNGVVMTHRALKDNELFEIRIDKLVDKWSGSIEVGVTTHNPAALHFPATMTNMRSGTIMMSGCGILTNGKGTRREYGEFNLDELREGDRVGMMRKSNGNLHYYINGQDQGVAATRVAPTLWGVIDLYGMTIKVTIVDRDEREQQNLVTRRNNVLSMQMCVEDMPAYSPETETVLNTDRLTFHPICGSHATVTQSGRTALRPSASDDFNNGVVLTRRQLRPNEVFQVRLERVISKWAGSIEIGVTTHNPTELDFPFTMTNVRTGTWMMTGNGVMHNGLTIIEQYGQNLDRLQAGDRVGVVRKDNGTLHFLVNGIDQGPAVSNVPDNVYGVIGK